MFDNDKLVRHKEFGLGIIYECNRIKPNTCDVRFSNYYKSVNISELTETNIKIESCYKIDDKIFFNLPETDKYLNKKEYQRELNNLVAIRPTDGNAKTVIDFVTKNSDELRKILNKYKDL